jgi:dTDP-4-dehydrorhamnose reductase
VTLKVLVTGAGGQLGCEISRLASTQPDLEVIAASSGELDVGDREAVLSAVGGHRPDLIVHAAAWTAVDACETDPGRAFRVNALGTRNVAEAAERHSAHLVSLSTDYVFDGTASRPYNEWDQTNPLSVYGASKLAGEREALSVCPGATVVRTSWVCGAFGNNMLKTILRLAAKDGPLRFVDDQVGCPTFTSDLAAMLLRLGRERAPGIVHVTNQGATSWYQFATEVVIASGGDRSRVQAITTDQLQPPRPAPRPKNSVLDNAVLRLSGRGQLDDYRKPLSRAVKELMV